MMTSSNNNPQWEILVSIANGVLKHPQPSLALLHHEVLEEMGKPPDQELIDYFLSKVDVSDEEIKEYFRFIGKLPQGGKDSAVSASPQALIEKIIANGHPSVLKFRQAYQKQFNENPPDHITKVFLEKMQSNARATPANHDQQLKLRFAEAVACGAQPTVLNLRTQFTQQFGVQPSEDIITYFLKKIPAAPQKSQNSEGYEAKVNFAKTVANGLISTVLQFRQAYEKVYSEPPTTDIIEIFIKNLSSESD